MPLAEAARQAAIAVASRPAGTRWLLACDTDADGLSAAAVMAAALRRIGHNFTVRASREKDEAAYNEIFAQEWDGLVLLDKGTSHLGLLSQHAQNTQRVVLVVDHHNVPPGDFPGVTLLNPRAVGLDGSRDASSSTTAEALALALVGEAALAWGPSALCGAIGDWQHVPDWQGWNLELLERCRAAGHVEARPWPRLLGANLADALTRIEPKVTGFVDLAATTEFLATLGIAPDVDVEDLDAETRTRLMSAVSMRLLAGGAPPSSLERLVAPTEFHVRLGTTLRQVFRVVDACGRSGAAATGIAYLMGDARAAAEAREFFVAYRSAIGAGLRRLHEQGTTSGRALQWAWTDDPAYTGMVAGLGITHVLRDRKRPVALLARRSDGKVQVSTRGTHDMVPRGLDLGRAVQAAAARVGGEGGGHPVAAGTVVAADKVDAFLAALDELLVAQRFAEKT